MAKTCRACTDIVMEAQCTYRERPFFYRAESCPHYKPRQTPLLVDALAKALGIVWDRRYTDGDEAGVTPGYTMRLTSAECDFIEQVLSRYQKEVGDE